MSEPETGLPDREWRLFVEDMIDFAEKALSYTNGLDRTGFETDGLTYDATVRNLELIGEAATHIPQTVRDDTPQIPWRQIVATRNRLIHGYLGIDNDTLWSIVTEDLPPLLVNLYKLKRTISNNTCQASKTTHSTGKSPCSAC
ncbi:MAG: DUF86 domain-containing protein [Magnetococcales bacterium]|nr:DUF86 domain-containing protein [Magnetococcales bacterium]